MAVNERKFPQQHYLTPEEYLEQERKAETRNEYYAGIVVEKSGGSWNHNLIVGNLAYQLHGKLKGQLCQPFIVNMRVGIPACEAYVYPDVLVVCGEAQLEDAHRDTLLNPLLVIEVLSKSTEIWDRGKRWLCYQKLESLQTHVLVSQDRPLVEVYRRQENGWHYSTIEGLENSLSLESIGYTLKLADIYDRVQFPEDEAASEVEEARKEMSPEDE